MNEPIFERGMPKNRLRAQKSRVNCVVKLFFLVKFLNHDLIPKQFYCQIYEEILSKFSNNRQSITSTKILALFYDCFHCSNQRSKLSRLCKQKSRLQVYCLCSCLKINGKIFHPTSVIITHIRKQASMLQKKIWFHSSRYSYSFAKISASRFQNL